LPVAQAVFSKTAFRDAEKELAQVRKAACRLVHWEESEYPKRLLEIYDPAALAVCQRE
jgi:predicted Rossmann fold nucleotide-binding protein DprA/Smf involved in DNA uptake